MRSTKCISPKPRGAVSLGEEDLAWLSRLTSEKLSDEEARALVFVREVGAVDNAAYRHINRTDTLKASQHLRRLRDLELLEMKGSGSQTYYVAGSVMGVGGARTVDPQQSAADSRNERADMYRRAANQRGAPRTVRSDLRELPPDPHMVTADLQELPPDPHMVTADLQEILPDLQEIPSYLQELPPEAHMVAANLKDLSPNPRELPADLVRRIRAAGPRPRKATVRSLIPDLCSLKPMGSRDIASCLGKRVVDHVVREHLRPMVESGELTYTIPEMPRHPHQKYRIPDT